MNTDEPVANVSLRHRVTVLRAEIMAAQQKERRVREAILSRQATLNRLQAQLALTGESGAARRHDK